MTKVKMRKTNKLEIKRKWKKVFKREKRQLQHWDTVYTMYFLSLRHD